jgi:hypothetical protein
MSYLFLSVVEIICCIIVWMISGFEFYTFLVGKIGMLYVVLETRRIVFINIFIKSRFGVVGCGGSCL